MSAHGTSVPAAARARHPSARSWSPDRSAVVERLADRARARGAPWPRVAAAVVMLRGISGDDRETFARRLGLSAVEVGALEAGEVGPSAIPPRLRAVEHLVDWSWVDGDAGRSAGGGGRVDGARRVPVRGSGRSGEA
jgi:hypothetical protein